MVKQALDARADAAAAERAALVAEMAQIDATAGTERVRYDAAIGEARKAIAVVEAAMREAIGKAVAIQNAFDRGRLARDSRREQIEATLKAGASPIIGDFRRFLMDEHDATCKTKIEIVHAPETRNQITGKRIPATSFSNKQSVDNRLGAIREALARVDELTMIPDQRQVADRIAETKASLPVITSPQVPAAGEAP
jgi:hypothetical protein